MAKGPGKSNRQGISILELSEMIPDEATAEKWFEVALWGDDRPCPHCGSLNTRACKNRKPMPYRCRDCREHFSVRTGTVMHRSRIPLKKWVWAIYLWSTSLKGISSMKLHRDLKISQPAAWFMIHRLRECFADLQVEFEGPVEVDETWMGGKRRNMHVSQRNALTGRGTTGKTAVAGIKDRKTNQIDAQVIDAPTGEALQSFVMNRVVEGAKIYTDDATAYRSLPNHESVNHSVGEYIKGEAGTNGIESFWAVLKRAQTGTFHKISYKHLQRYVNEFAGRHNLRRCHTMTQMVTIAAAMVGRRLMYRELTRPDHAKAGFLAAN